MLRGVQPKKAAHCGGFWRPSHAGSHSHSQRREWAWEAPTHFLFFRGRLPLPTSGAWNLSCARSARRPRTCARPAERRRKPDNIIYQLEAAMPPFMLGERNAHGGAGASARMAAIACAAPVLLECRLRGQRRYHLVPLSGAETCSAHERRQPTAQNAALRAERRVRLYLLLRCINTVESAYTRVRGTCVSGLYPTISAHRMKIRGSGSGTLRGRVAKTLLHDAQAL